MTSHMFACLLAVVALSAGCWSKSPSSVPGDVVSNGAGACGDFLETLGKKPLYLRFVGCKEGKLAQIRALIASYEVEGKHARHVETSLGESFGMKPMEFACCGWEARSASYALSEDEHYELSMYSAETLEKEIERVSVFHVTVHKMLELP